MNIKLIAIFLMLAVASPLGAMAPGTLIDPLNHSGQFTVSEFKNTLPAASKSASECTGSLSSATTDLFKTKGMPVLISSAASAMPWWALTTGTGYLLISQAAIPQEGLTNALIGGASYGLGEKIAQQNNIFTQLALCAACCAVSCASPATAVQEACFAIAQSVTIYSVVDATQTILAANKTQTNKQLQPDSTEKVVQTNAPLYSRVFNSSLDTLKTFMPGICFGIIQTQDANAMLKILLYEHAYRLAQSGCNAAQEFLRN